jgi:histidinol-phosphate/aromatic aminotransferase/cobyric acid decarboxylase-like protein
MRIEMQTEDDFGAQGGDPRRMVGNVRIDLSTCVNFYGPPPAALEVLRTAIGPADLQIHPYAAAERMEALYARYLGVDAGDIVAGRGTTEFIWALSRQVRHDGVAVPLPAYTDYLKAFPGRGYPGGPVPTIEQIDAALAAARLVIISNPHNPSGVALPAAALVAAASRHPHATFVVDESYVDFLADPAAASVVGADAENLVVLRSPSKFWGIAATRVGIAWCRDRERLERLLGRRETWPISGLDVAVAEAAMGSAEWATGSRRALRRDAAWLAAALRWLPGRLIEQDVGVHYRCLVSERAEEIAARFAEHGVGVRVLGRAHGARVPLLRILAPLRHQRAALLDGVRAVVGAGADGATTDSVLAAV